MNNNNNSSSHMNIELSIVIPCLNEADTLQICLDKAFKVIEKNELNAEVIVADNGSTDDSIKIVNNSRARLIKVSQKGYGAALMGGIEAAKGKFVVMGDADDSYDFSDFMKFIEKLREGYDMVMGSRFPSGGGEIKRKAMPFLHQYFGNPFFAFLARTMFRAPIHDPYCGFRGFTKKLYDDLHMKCTGMEFAIELILKTVLLRKKIAEVPVILYPDGRKAHAPHLRTFRDGWRTLRFFLLLSPAKIFFIPGVLLTGLSSAVGMLLYFHPVIQNSLFYSLNTFIYVSLCFLLGIQIVFFGFFAETFAMVEGLIPESKYLNQFYQFVTIEKGMIVALLLFVAGALIGFNSFDTLAGKNEIFESLKLVFLSSTLLILSVQLFFSTLLISSLGLHRK